MLQTQEHRFLQTVMQHGEMRNLIWDATKCPKKKKQKTNP